MDPKVRLWVVFGYGSLFLYFAFEGVVLLIWKGRGVRQVSFKSILST